MDIGMDDIAEDHMPHLLWLDSRTLDRLADNGRAQFSQCRIRSQAFRRNDSSFANKPDAVSSSREYCILLRCICDSMRLSFLLVVVRSRFSAVTIVQHGFLACSLSEGKEVPTWERLKVQLS